MTMPWTKAGHGHSWTSMAVRGQIFTKSFLKIFTKTFLIFLTKSWTDFQKNFTKC